MSKTAGVEKLMNSLETIVTAMCIIYGIILLLVYLTSLNTMMPCFLDPLVIGLVFLLLGIYPFVRKKSLERLRKSKQSK